MWKNSTTDLCLFNLGLSVIQPGQGSLTLFNICRQKLEWSFHIQSCNLILNFANMKKRKGIGIPSILFFFLAFLAMQFFISPSEKAVKLTYDQFKDSLRTEKIDRLILTQDKITGYFKQPADSLKKSVKDTTHVALELPWLKPGSRSVKFEVVRLDDEQLLNELQQHHVAYQGRIQSDWFVNLLGWIVPIFILFLIWGFLFRRVNKNVTGSGTQNIFNVGRSRAKLFVMDENHKITFDDVAGVDEAKEELSEMIEFLKNPERFTRLGARLPKGVLLVGPPGTGKTLLARAVAGEANVPFFSLTGSDFVEMFVGVGAARVRDLFKEAKTKAPCIIFIDEIDAIGKSRGAALQLSSNDERENTLNQLLSEMDGFAPGDAIILIGSTNRPEVLDWALLRPGRFDRQVLVDKPDLKGRQDILKVHTRELVLHKDTDLKAIAAQTPGFSGADLANICNEAALLASRKGKKYIELNDFQEAIERVIAGLERKNRLINAKERRIVAYHESGHAIVGYFTPGADPVQKVSIVPRGIGALGYTLQSPLEDRFLMSKSELLGKIKGMLGGRAAEEIVFNDISTGASNDLEKVTQIAYDMITIYGMSDKVKNLSLKKRFQNQLLGNDILTEKRSEKMEQIIDDEALGLIDKCYQDAKKLLEEKRNELEKMAEILLDKEVLDANDVKAILGKT